MVVANSPLKLVGLSQGAANGVQTIVNLQFRKEHRALLDLFEDLKTRMDKTSASAERRFEESQKQLEETENRLEKLENETRDLMQKNKEWENEVKDLKDKIMKLSELMGAGIPPFHGRLSDLGLQQSQLQSATPSPVQLVGTTDLQPTSPQAGCDMPAAAKPLSTPTTAQPKQVSQHPSALVPVLNRIIEGHNNPSNRRTSHQATSPLALNSQMNPPPPLSSPARTPTLVNSSSPILAGKPLHRAAPRKVTSRMVGTSRPWINISQAQDQNIETYLAHAAEYIGAIKVRTTQFEFIARFIGGLRNENDRDVLLKQLQKKFSSRTTKDGFVEVRCGFPDVRDGLVAVGLIDGGSRKRNADEAGINNIEMDTPRQTRNKTLNSQVSEDDDDDDEL